MPHTNIICKHEPCLCEVADPGAFCSSYCKEAWEDNIADAVCQCGHRHCQQAIGEAAGTDTEPTAL